MTAYRQVERMGCAVNVPLAINSMVNGFVCENLFQCSNVAMYFCSIVPLLHYDAVYFDDICPIPSLFLIISGI